MERRTLDSFCGDEGKDGEGPSPESPRKEEGALRKPTEAVVPLKAKRVKGTRDGVPEAKPDMLSPSQINAYISCPRRWFFRYVLKLPEEETFPMARGSAVHSVAERFFEYRPAPGMTLKEAESALRRRGRMLLEEAWKKGEIAKKWPGEPQDGAQAIVDRFVTRVVWQLEDKMGKLASRKGRPADLIEAWNYIVPTRREMEVRDEEIGLKGIIDAVIEKNGQVFIEIPPEEEGQIHIHDYKTSSVFLHPHNDEYERQLLMYALLYMRNTGKLPKVVSIEYMMTGETWSFPVRREMVDDIAMLVKDVRAKLVSRRMDDYPRDAKRKFCNWCSFVKECSEGAN